MAGYEGYGGKCGVCGKNMLQKWTSADIGFMFDACPHCGFGLSNRFYEDYVNNKESYLLRLAGLWDVILHAHEVNNLKELRALIGDKIVSEEESDFYPGVIIVPDKVFGWYKEYNYPLDFRALEGGLPPWLGEVFVSLYKKGTKIYLLGYPTSTSVFPVPVASGYVKEVSKNGEIIVNWTAENKHTQEFEDNKLIFSKHNFAAANANKELECNCCGLKEDEAFRIEENIVYAECRYWCSDCLKEHRNEQTASLYSEKEPILKECPF